jgi:hypothetical protein
MEKSEMIEELIKILARVAGDSSLRPLLPGLCYTGPEDFVLQHGRYYRPAPFSGYKQGAPLQCFGNAMVLAATHGLGYVEGFVVAPDDGKIILHGWNEDPTGHLVDVTWCNAGVAYLGVRFSVERADDAGWNGDGCVLNDEHRNYPIYQQPWQGEDYARQWPHSDRLEALQRRPPTGQIPRSVQQWLSERNS